MDDGYNVHTVHVHVHVYKQEKVGGERRQGGREREEGGKVGGGMEGERRREEGREGGREKEGGRETCTAVTRSLTHVWDQRLF